MSKFTVIEGGGPPNHHDSFARQALQLLIVEILRSLARGHDETGRSAHQLSNLFEHLSATKTSAASIVSDVIAELHQEVLPEKTADPFDTDRDDIVRDCLKAAAERCAIDDAAKSRASQRTNALRATIDQYILDRERRARENGLSYVGRLVENYFPPKPKRKRRKRIEL